MGFDLWKTLGVSAATGVGVVLGAVVLAAVTALGLRLRRSRAHLTALGLDPRRG
jgi:hypothetical protein